MAMKNIQMYVLEIYVSSPKYSASYCSIWKHGLLHIFIRNILYTKISSFQKKLSPQNRPISSVEKCFFLLKRSTQVYKKL